MNDELVNKYLELARVSRFIASGAEVKALEYIAVVLATTDPVTELLQAKTQAELDIRQNPDLAEYYVHKIKWYDQALADLLS